MELSPMNELRLLGICLLCGGALGFLFDLFKVPRRLIKTGVKQTLVQDLLYFIFAGGITIYTIQTKNSGILRGYELLGLFLGFLLYTLLLSPIILPILVFLTRFLLLFLKKFLFFITFPLRIFIKPVIIVSVSLRQFLRKIKKGWSTFFIRLSRALLFIKKT